MGQVIDLVQAREALYGKPARISVSLKRLARENRRELSRSFPYMRFWLMTLSPAEYGHFLRLHLTLRETLESHFQALGGRFDVVNLLLDEHKKFALADYLSPANHKANLIRRDLAALGLPTTLTGPTNVKLSELITYIKRTAQVYSVALLGVVYMLEQNLASAGEVIAANLRQNHGLPDSALNYLTAFHGRKRELWQFSQALDTITDFQTQANVVIAATITYELHRELLDPHCMRRSLEAMNRAE
ncbi:hypothetical protein [Halioxenophilus sp. WMMB6]|uniref:hypothetical protein n=1 Tax=Halioxenophilus sp. WMMB6 TaxID=3073815 RepID=UPI00295EBBD9|nr:hypothetical protein [Halioxenophilus sp. WMMB6]